VGFFSRHDGWGEEDPTPTLPEDGEGEVLVPGCSLFGAIRYVGGPGLAVRRHFDGVGKYLKSGGAWSLFVGMSVPSPLLK
jgi:hypothetical protein